MDLFIFTIANLKKGTAITHSASYSMGLCPLTLVIAFPEGLIACYSDKIIAANDFYDPSTIIKGKGLLRFNCSSPACVWRSVHWISHSWFSFISLCLDFWSCSHSLKYSVLIDLTSFFGPWGHSKMMSHDQWLHKGQVKWHRGYDQNLCDVINQFYFDDFAQKPNWN